MKRIFLVSGICFVLCFLSVSVFASQNTATDRAIDVLQTLKLINEDYDIHIATQTGNVTRAEFADNVAKIFVTGEKSEKLYFHDVPRGHWAVASVSSLVDRNIILVDESARFNPDEYISKMDAVKILLRGLGYGVFCDEMGKTDGELLEIAKRAGILDNVSGLQNVSTDNMFLMLYNSLMAETLEINIVMDGEANYIPSGQTYLEQNFSSYMKTGVLEGYDGSALSSIKLNENQAIISGEVYEASEFDLSDMIGLNIMYLYEYDEKADRKTILWACVKNDKNCLKLDYEDNSISFDANNYILTYYEQNTEKTVKLDKGISLIYNGEFTDKSIDSLLGNPFKAITLVKNSATGRYDVAIMTAYENYLVSGIDYKEKTVYDKISKQRISFDLTERVDVYSASGSKILFEDIKNDDIVSVFRSLSGDRVRIVVSDTAVEGMVTALKTEMGCKVAIIDGIKYLFKSGADSSLCKVKSEVKIYLDAYGYIAYMQARSRTDGVAFVLYAGYDEREECMYLELLDETGKPRQIKIEQKIEIDGKNYKYIKQAFNILGNTRQLICYRTNKNGEIISIDTEIQGKDENKSTSLHKVQDFESVLYKSWGMIGNKINIDGNTVIFCIPNSIMSADREEFGVKKMSDLKNDTWYYCASYAVNDRVEYDEILIIQGYDWNVPSDNLPGILVSEKGQMLNDENTVVDYVEGQRGNEKVRVLCSDDYSLSEIKSGDFIIASLNGKGEITSARIAYSPASENIKRPSEPLSNVACLVTSGYVNDVIGNMVHIGYENSDNYDSTFNFNLGTVLIYDTENEKIEKGSVNDLISGKVSGDEGSLVLAQFNWMMPIVYVIYK